MLDLLCILLPVVGIAVMMIPGKSAARDLGEYFWYRHIDELEQDGEGEIEVDRTAPDRREGGAS